MSFFERFRGPSRIKQESTDPSVKAAQAERQVASRDFEASLADVENLDLSRERERLNVDLEMENIKPLEQRDKQRIEQTIKRIQEIDAIMERARNEAVQKLQK
jgi:hypothetical protein